jgi:hypothetical protein
MDTIMLRGIQDAGFTGSKSSFLPILQRIYPTEPKLCPFMNLNAISVKKSLNPLFHRFPKLSPLNVSNAAARTL